MTRFRSAVALVSLALLSACASRRLPPAPAPVSALPAPAQTPAPTPRPIAPSPPLAAPENARVAGIALLPPPATLGEPESKRALAAFLVSCPAVQKRSDKSGLSLATDWVGVCAAAKTVPLGGAASFFRDSFDWVRVGSGEMFATGYYEPEIAGSRVKAPGFDVPVYRKPDDLTRCTRPDGGSGRGRIDAATGACSLYYTRAEIEDGALANRNLEIAWVADPVELFFLHIQGSGQIKLPDGTVVRVGYHDQNGRDYVAIGRLLRARGLLPDGGAKMQDITFWLRAHPVEGKALMRENLSYIFFRELAGLPLGALDVPVSPQATVAADPAFVPLGAPVYLIADRPDATGLWVAQDTGGAIKGANRFDTFWGAGREATLTAGGMSASGAAFVLLPRGTAARVVALQRPAIMGSAVPTAVPNTVPMRLPSAAQPRPVPATVNRQVIIVSSPPARAVSSQPTTLPARPPVVTGVPPRFIPPARVPIATQVPPLTLPAATASLAAAPRLLSGGPDREDYRRLRARIAGSTRAGLRLTIGPDGRVTQCLLVTPTGYPAVDAGLCPLLQPRMIWAPARDRSGRPISSWLDFVVTLGRN